MEVKKWQKEYFSENELALLITIFEMGKSMIEGLRNSDEYYDWNMRNTLYDLAIKLGVDDIVF